MLKLMPITKKYQLYLLKKVKKLRKIWRLEWLDYSSGLSGLRWISKAPLQKKLQLYRLVNNI